MNLFSLVTPGLETIAQQEVQELLKTKAKISPSVIEFSMKSKEEAIYYLYHAQSARRILVSLGKFKDVETITFDTKFPWTDYFSPETSFKIEVEGVSGQENRFEIAGKVAGKLFDVLKKIKIEPKIEFKKPGFLIIVFYNGKDYFLGIDLAGKELNSRDYRLFLHSASIKGDLAYYFVRKAGFTPGEKLLVGFCKDGTVAVEAALFANGAPVHKNNILPFPGFKEVTDQKRDVAPQTIYAGDGFRSNIIASKKNSWLAGVKKVIEFQQLQLEELSTYYSEQEFHRAIFYLTAPEEDKLNEILYQVKFILKPLGTVLFIGREEFEPAIPKEFILKESSAIAKGGKSYSLWLLEKKP